MRLEHLLSGESGVFDAARPKLHAEVNGQKEHLLSGVAVEVVYDGDFHIGLHVMPWRCLRVRAFFSFSVSSVSCIYGELEGLRMYILCEAPALEASPIAQLVRAPH